MQKAAQAWLIVTMTGSRSGFFLGLDSFLGEFPLLLFTMVGGVFADRCDRRHMILISQIIQMLLALALALLIHERGIHVAAVLEFSFIGGCVRAIGGPAYQSLLPTLVGQEDLPNAVALNSVQFNLAQVIGPLMAGAVLATFGMVACFGLNSISFLFVIAAILALRDVHVPSAASKCMLAQFRDGFRFVKASPNFIIVMVLGFLAAFLGTPLLTFLPVIIRDVYHQGVGLYTQLMTFSGVGAITGALVVAYRGKHNHMGRTLMILLALFGAIIASFGLSRNTHLVAWILFSGGALSVMCSSLITSLAQLLAPPEFPGARLVYLPGRVSGRLTARWTCKRMAHHASMLSVRDVTDKWRSTHVSGAAVLFDPWSAPQNGVKTE